MANFAGEWSVVYHVDSCLGRYCYAAAAFPWTASFELKQFDVRFDPARGLTGRIDFASLMSGDDSAYSYGATGPIVSGARHPLDTASFNGTWRGYYARTSCAPAASCVFPEQDDATIVLQDAGGTISGIVTVFPRRLEVTGRSSGDSAELRGQYQLSMGNPAEVVVRVQRSSTGRLTGTVELAAVNGESRSFTLLSLVPAAVP